MGTFGLCLGTIILSALLGVAVTAVLTNYRHALEIEKLKVQWFIWAENEIAQIVPLNTQAALILELREITKPGTPYRKHLVRLLGPFLGLLLIYGSL